jgi:glycosyltransferase involved in cell wall biosynthesis
VRIALVYHMMRLDAGIPKMHVQLARYLVGRGHEVHVYGNLADSDPLLTREVIFHDVGVPQRTGRLAAPWAVDRTMRRVGSMLLEDRSDVVHGRGISSWVQDIAHVTGVYRSERRGRIESRGPSPLSRRVKDFAHPVAYPMGRLRSLHERRIARDRSIMLHAETNGVARDLVSAYGIDPDRIRVVVPGVDIQTFSPHGPRADLGLDEPVVVFCGHDYQRKGLDRLLRALPRMATQASLAVVGGGTHSHTGWGEQAVEPYRRLAGELGILDRVRFLGAQRDVAPIIRAADVLAHPARFDVWGLAVTEGMAAGLPVLVSRSTGASELVDDRSGRVLERADDADEIASALDSLLDPGRRDTIGRAAREIAMQISTERQGALVEADMARIVSARRARGVATGAEHPRRSPT